MSYHLVGIGGIGMSALARLLLDKQESVSGSDLKKSPLLETLQEAGAQICPNQRGEQLSHSSTVVYSTAVRENNPEMARARELGCTLLHRADLLSQLMSGYKTLAVTGTHGKTTTSALLAWTLLQCDQDPAFALGGILPGLSRNGRHGQGPYFVVEADESDGSFLKCAPHAAIVTNIEAEHLDQWGTFEKLKAAFDQFIDHVRGPLILCADDPLLQDRGGITYGFSSHAHHPLTNFHQEGFSLTFDLPNAPAIEVPLIGRHNALNAAAVFLLCRELGLPETAIREALKSFPGIARRLEKKGETRGALFLDDYAHHPTEIKATLDALRAAIGERRLIACFQPHRYTRTRDCWEEWATCFAAADQVIVHEIYSAGEEPIEGITREALQALIPNAAPTLALRPHDVAITLGAGDITHTFDTPPPVEKLQLGLLYGGPSPEHDISRKSAQTIASALNPDLYSLTDFPIPKAQTDLDQLIPQLMNCELFLPIFHGPQGEDGLWPALLELLGKPFIGPDFRACSLAMDKARTKQVAVAAGIPTLPFLELTPHDPLPTLPWPCAFVKPVHLGSSVGVSRITHQDQLAPALAHAFTHDDRIILEQGIDARDLEVGVLGNKILHTTPPGEILTGDSWYTYEGKISDNATPTQTIADLPPEIATQAQTLAKATYRALDCRGCARIDFFLDRDQNLYLNEVNPIPGFTPISLYPKMWEAAGLPLPQLLDQLIILAK